MNIEMRTLRQADMQQATEIWNFIVEEANSFPGDQVLCEAEAALMFAQQTETVCALRGDEVVGLYILHPNNIGRCGHIANASFGVKPAYRGKGIGRQLVEDCLKRSQDKGFKGLQFNAVVSTNYPAITLYLKLGFKIIGTIKDGYRLKDNVYVDTLIFLKSW
ncbi:MULTISPECIES: GNAT family N-acetyltransferase [Acetobacterium]|jgi:ribosomal protein S18 acetylase RimI-like enzyme|uniref:GNAT family N-acetyltransferase n=1 Tax=Acetobacterium TaxID=33951 RepID=UPI000B9D070F|nr:MULTISPECIES: N-acetyltransferase [Acetobacterium]MEA4807082.1 N-acetyltransferase [Acetobacterium wieringae]OXS27109.1 MAG: GNAT family N-acetyltransferase [Acetobacterium sp. MES1]